MVDDHHKPHGSDTLVIPFEIPWSIGGAAERPPESGAQSRQDAQPEPHPAQRAPPAPKMKQRSEKRTPSAESRLIMARVSGEPALALSGGSDGDLTLWGDDGDPPEPKPLASVRLDLDGSQLFAAGEFIGRLFEGEGSAVLDPAWLRGIGAATPPQHEPKTPGPLSRSQAEEREASGHLPGQPVHEEPEHATATPPSRDRATITSRSGQTSRPLRSVPASRDA